jgi:hypothetical protein
MLKPPLSPAEGGNDRHIGDIVHQLIDDAKDYARAEVDLAKVIAADKTKRIRTAAAFLVAALFIAMGALNALCIGILLGFDTLMSPVLAGICAFLLIGAVAGLLAWIGIGKLRDSV